MFFLCKQALDLKPNYVRAWANMGISYANQVGMTCILFDAACQWNKHIHEQLHFVFGFYRVCMRNQYATMSEHLQWILRQIMLGNTWGFLSGSNSFCLCAYSLYVSLAMHCKRHSSFDLYSCASRTDMLDACDARNLDVLQKEFPLWIS